MTAMSRATRRIVVAHLTERGMNPAQIASELGVSKETVRRDLHNSPPPTSVSAEEDVAANEAGLCLPDDPQLGKDLRILAAAHQAPAEEVVRQLLHRAAEAVRRRWTS